MAAQKKAPKKSNTATGIRNSEKENYKNAVMGKKNAVKAIILFAVSVLTLFLVVIQGENVWLAVHNFIFGIFGFCAFFLPFFLFGMSLLLAFNRQHSSLTPRLIECGGVVLSLCFIIDVFAGDPQMATDYINYLVQAYDNGKNIIGGGWLGGVIGYPLQLAVGDACAAIILILVMFILLMLVFELDLATLILGIKKLFTRKKDTEEQEEISAKPVKGKQTKNEPVPEEPENKPFKYDIPVDGIPENRDRTSEGANDKCKKLIETYYDESETVENNDSDVKQPEITEDTTVVATKTTRKKKEPVETDEASQQVMYQYPPINLLKVGKKSTAQAKTEIEDTANRLVEVLRSFGVETRMLSVSQGPTVTRYELQPSVGVKISKITNLADDIALNLAAAGVRIEAPIPNKAAVGIEVPNRNNSVVTVRDVIETPEFQNAKSKLTVALGKDISGKVVLADIASMPHGLIAGSTGSGKSVCINSILMSLLYRTTPDEVKFILIDPKMVELSNYNGIPHLLVPVVTDPRKASGVLAWAVNEMERRYKLLADNNVRELESYNYLANLDEDLTPMPQIVIVIDELADLMMTAPKEVEDSINRIAAKARAAGMHLIIATQRPSADVVTGVIKSNVPTRIAFAVASQIDSRIILDMAGAEKLIGKGDMLFNPLGANKPVRVQGCYVSDKEIESVIDFVKQDHTQNYDEAVMDEINRLAAKDKTAIAADDDDGESDPMLEAAIECVVDNGMASTSLLQRKLKLGYARAARIMDEMEAKGVIGPFEGAKPRQVLITREQLMEKQAGEE
ncbi:MAG: DNA translocase FtsK 4TM domain-containing protein [Oscillospiraceae bacterium]|nr:DNA translocase FtsK 4TM domain-containing protein [Candidatus Equicaccousia limihippi]